MAVRIDYLKLDYRCTRCQANFQYPILVDAWQETAGDDKTVITFVPHPVQEVHDCKERVLNY